MAICELRGISKHYGSGATLVKALDEVDLSFEAGEFTVISGPSGSGKTTLLNLVGCLDAPTAGSVLLEGRDVSRIAGRAQAKLRANRIGFIFQSFNLIPQLTVAENIEVPLFYQGLSPAESRKKSEAIADRVGLADRLHHRPTELSGGQQQRVAIARALVNDPAIVLADEATGNLDSATEREILEVMDQLHSMGKTIILVTHNASLTRHAQKVMVLADGKIESLHTREDLDAAGENVI